MKHRIPIWPLIIVVLLLASFSLAGFATHAAPRPAAAQQNEYVILGWNDLGMHCYDRDYSDTSVLPPYNTLWAQVVKRGNPPSVITQGIVVEYDIPGNTESATKTNFWDYASQLFGTDVQPNVGLAGKGLTGVMDAKGDHFEAVGIPLTEFPDATPDQPNYFQLAHLVVKDAATGQILAETTPVIPVSSEMHCDTCHNVGAGTVRQNILALHDQEEGTDLMNQRPVLCASCHADPALAAAGQPDIPSLSAAMHGKHVEEGVDPNSCYACHPGPTTQCLRDTHAVDQDMMCTNCHGDMSKVADPQRVSWKDLPQCGQCHDAQHTENPNTLYRFSTGHSGIYCEACHNSTHAIWPSREANDNVQIIALQGEAEPLGQCTVCHLSQPEMDEGPHQGDEDD